METKFAKIVVNKYDDIFSLKLNINNNLSWHEKRVNYDKIIIDSLLYWWMLKAIKPIFFEMPLEKIDCVCSKDVYEKLGGNIDNCNAIIKRTNDAMNRYSHLKNVAKGNSNIIPFNIDGGSYRYKELFEKCCNGGTSGTLYLNMDSGFNEKTRTWEDRDVPLPLSELIDIVVNEGIKKIVSINHYVLERYLYKTGVHLVPLFRYIGIEYVIIDQDLWDDFPHGYLMKSFFTCNSFDRFSCTPAMNEYWDNKYGLKNIHYICVPQDYDENGDIIELKENYGVLVLSNSRFDLVKPRIKSILYLLDHMEDDNVFTQVQLWYWSLRHMVLEILSIDEFERLRYNCFLHRFFYAVTQLLKYEVIESINETRRVEIYGDIGWKSIFPEYYQKYLNINEIDELFSERRHLYLLLNYAISYLDASGPIFDAISGNVPFINCPALVKTSAFEGFRHIEYTNKEELNYLIKNIRSAVDNEELKESMRIFMKVLKSNVNELEEKIVNNRNAEADRGMFGKECKEHKVLLDQMAEEYIDRNEPFLRETFRVLLLGEPVQYDASKSRYFNRKYVQRIFESIREDQEASARGLSA